MLNHMLTHIFFNYGTCNTSQWELLSIKTGSFTLTGLGTGPCPLISGLNGGLIPGCPGIPGPHDPRSTDPVIGLGP